MSALKCLAMVVLSSGTTLSSRDEAGTVPTCGLWRGNRFPLSTVPQTFHIRVYTTLSSTIFEDVSMIRSLDPDSGLADNSLNRCLDDPKSALGGPSIPD